MVKVWPLYRGAIGLFYDPSRQGKLLSKEADMYNIKKKERVNLSK